ncbi:MAG: hypothetical protein ACREL6_07505 [Gemmatimonadales bacterium]
MRGPPRISPFVTHRRRRSDEYTIPRETPEEEMPDEEERPVTRPVKEDEGGDR